MMNCNNISTVQNAQPDSFQMVARHDLRLPNHSTCGNANESNLQTGNVIKPNYPRLWTKEKLLILKLSFLKRCRILRRPPQQFRISASKLTQQQSFINCATIAESELLNSGIEKIKKDINQIKNCIDASDKSLLLPPDQRQIQNLQKSLDRKFSWLTKEDKIKWENWPSKILLKPSNHVTETKFNRINPKRHKNAAKK